MEYQVARLQEIVTKIQYYCKLNFKNAVDIGILLQAENMNIEDINKLIGAGVRKVGFHNIEQLGEIEHLLLPCKKYYLGELEGNNLSPVLANFETIESIINIEHVRLISDLNARTGRVTNILARMNILSEIKKFGFSPAEISDICLEIAKISGVRLTGINTYVPPLENIKMRKTALRKASVMFKMLEARFRGMEVFSLNYISQFEDLIGEGVNEIRIGIKDLA